MAPERFFVIAAAVCILIGSSSSSAFADDVEINAVEFPKGEADEFQFGKKNAEHVDNPLRMETTKQMVDRILARLKEGDCIKTLNIYGHGAEGRISTGKGMAPPDSTNETSYINGDKPNGAVWRPELERLKGRFCKEGASVNLYGCNVGAGDVGAAKLSEIAKLLGVEVGGAVDRVRGGEDYNKTEKNWQTAKPDGVKPKPKPKPS